MIVDCDFPGGNIIVESVQDGNITVRPDLRDTGSDWFYWYFRVRGAAGSQIKVQFTCSNYVIGVRGPGVSLDAGETWYWLGADAASGNSFLYRVPASADEVRFSAGMPYLEADLNAFLKPHRNTPFLEAGELCKSEGGRSVEALRLGRLDGSARHRVFLTCRHHCCEMMANYVLEGLMETVLDDQEHGAWLRREAEFFIVPFVDKDGVEQGDQGKNRIPHDHNRDYSGQSRYASVRAIRQTIPHWGGNRLRLALDLHCPNLHGRHGSDKRNESTFFVYTHPHEIAECSERFARILADNTNGSLPHNTADNLPFGQAWNKPSNSQGSSCKAWASKLPGIEVAATLEIPYANARGREVNADTARAFGHDLAASIQIWLDR